MKRIEINRKALGVAFIVTLACWAIAWAVTVDEVWRSVYDSTHTALRINQVTP
jgi:hypothetical protein